MKLRALKGDFKKWNGTEFGNVTIKRMELWNDLNALDYKTERVSLSADEKLENERICMEIERLPCWRRLASNKNRGYYV